MVSTAGDNRIYVTDTETKSPDYVAVIDSVSNSVVRTIDVNNADAGLTFLSLSPDGRKLYFSGANDAQAVAVIDTTSFQVVGNIAVGNEVPRLALAGSVAFNPNPAKPFAYLVKEVSDGPDQLVIIDTRTNVASGRSSRGIG